MQVKNSEITLKDFTLHGSSSELAKEIGHPVYQFGHYLILVGRCSYSIAYCGATLSFGLDSITEALRIVNTFEAQRTKAAGIFAAARAARRAR